MISHKFLSYGCYLYKCPCSKLKSRDKIIESRTLQPNDYIHTFQLVVCRHLRPPQRTQNSRIHTILFHNSRIHTNFSGNSRKPDFLGNRENFSERLGKYLKIGEKGKIHVFTQKQGRFTHSRNQEVDFHVHASFFNSRIHAIFLHFHAFTQPKKPIHAFTQTAGAPHLYR